MALTIFEDFLEIPRELSKKSIRGGFKANVKYFDCDVDPEVSCR